MSQFLRFQFLIMRGKIFPHAPRATGFPYSMDCAVAEELAAVLLFQSYLSHWLFCVPAAWTACWQACAAVSNSSNFLSLCRPRSNGSDSRLEYEQ